MGLDTSDDWALWMDVDLVDYPANILRRLLAEREKIVTPDCLLEKDEPSFDMNAFLDVSINRYMSDYYRYALHGISSRPPITIGAVVCMICAIWNGLA